MNEEREGGREESDCVTRSSKTAVTTAERCSCSSVWEVDGAELDDTEASTSWCKDGARYEGCEGSGIVFRLVMGVRGGESAKQTRFPYCCDSSEWGTNMDAKSTGADERRIGTGRGGAFEETDCEGRLKCLDGERTFLISADSGSETGTVEVGSNQPNQMDNKL